MIQELLAMGYDRERIIGLYVQAGMPKPDAEFIYAIETGEAESDVIVVDEDGNEHAPDSPELT